MSKIFIISENIDISNIREYKKYKDNIQLSCVAVSIKISFCHSFHRANDKSMRLKVELHIMSVSYCKNSASIMSRRI